jgi:hypothetical protein
LRLIIAIVLIEATPTARNFDGSTIRPIDAAQARQVA